MKRQLEIDKRADIVTSKATLIEWLQSYNERYWNDSMQRELNRHIMGANGVGGYLNRLKGNF